MIELLAQVHWRYPALWLLALWPLLLMITRAPDTSLPQRLGVFAEPRLLRQLLTGRVLTSKKQVALYSLAWLLAVAALAGPYLESPAQTTPPIAAANIALIVDISPSMAATDVMPSRLARVKLKLRDLIQARGQDRYGLIVFSANAYVTLPLTYDKQALLHYIDSLDPSLVTKRGSHLAPALSLVLTMLEETPRNSRAALLITDGEFHDRAYLDLARRLRQQEIPLHILAVGTAQGAPVVDGTGHFLYDQGQPVIARLQLPSLQALADLTQGHLAVLSAEDSDWQALNARLERSRALHTRPVTAAQDLRAIPWLLLMSVLLFLWVGLRRYHLVAALLSVTLLTLVPPHAARAATHSEQQAYAALQRGEHARAMQLYQGLTTYTGLMGYGVSAYRQQQWQTAYTAFLRASAQAQTADERAIAAYNSGNALARLGRYPEAADAYHAALRTRRHYPQAAHNLTLINQYLEQQRQAHAPSTPQAAAQTFLDLDSATQDNQAPSTQDKASAQGSLTATAAPSHATAAPDTTALRRRVQALPDQPAELLRRRFALQDRQRLIVEDKPW